MMVDPLFVSFTFLDPRSWGSFPFIVLVIAILWGRQLLLRSPFRPARAVAEGLFVVAAYFLYFLVRGLVDIRLTDAYDNAARIIRLEQALGIFREPELQRWALEFPAVVTLINVIYVWWHWPLIAITVIWLYRSHPTRYPLYRNAILISGAIGLVIFATFPVAPPRFMDDWGFVDTITLHSRSYRVLQPPSLTNKYAALPSLHFGWNLLIGIAIARHARGHLRWLGIITPVAMFLSIILTANHYILDGIAGGALALLGLLLAARLPHTRDRLRRAWQARRRAGAEHPQKPVRGLSREGPQPDDD